MSLIYEPLSDRYEDALSAVSSYAFNTPIEDRPKVWDVAGRENVRVVRDGQEVIGTALLIWMGQHFLGRRVPICGVAGVAITPGARGKGAGRFLMHEVMRESRAKAPISSLYASTVPLYQSMGYERTGGRYQANCRTKDLPRGRTICTVRPIEEADNAAVEGLRNQRVGKIHGSLDLNSFMWSRIRTPKFGKAFGFLFEDPAQGTPVGYAYISFPKHYEYERLDLLDWSASTPEAFQTLLSFLGGHSTIMENLYFATEPRDPLLFALADRHYEMRCLEHWLLRLADVGSALEARGYPSGLSLRLEFELTDEHFEDNAGRWVLQIEDGRAHTDRGGSGGLRMGVRELAALYTGQSTTDSLALAGRIQGSEAELAAAATAFASPAAAMLQRF